MDMQPGNLKVNFDGRIVEYDVTELDELTLAYATTIHKAQGSEYPIVVSAGTDEPFCDAAEKPDLHRDHPCKKDSCAGRDTKSTRLCCAECDGDKKKYPFEGKIAGKVLIAGRGTENIV